MTYYIDSNKLIINYLKKCNKVTNISFTSGTLDDSERNLKKTSFSMKYFEIFIFLTDVIYN